MTTEHSWGLLSQQEANRLISLKLEFAYNLIKDCTEIADACRVSFCLPWGGEGTSERGLGGEYVPEGSDALNYHDKSGWNASSHSC